MTSVSLSTWTHHSLLKATAPVVFSQGRLTRGCKNKEARELLREMTRAREAFLEQIGSPANPRENVVRVCDEYLALLQGLVDASGVVPRQAPTAEPAEAAENADNEGGDKDKDGEDKDTKKKSRESMPESYVRSGLRNGMLFKWLDALTGEIREYEDAQAEVICVLLNMGLWHCMHASVLQTSASHEDDDAMKEIYQTLRTAASYFQCVERSELSRYEYCEDCDMDERLVKSMAIQCLAEAQEVTCNRARFKGHAPKLVAGIAQDEADRFRMAHKCIDKMDEKIVGDMITYLDFKTHFYEAFALCYNGIAMHSEEKCGDAVKVLREAQTKMAECASLAEAYSKSRAKRKNLKKKTESVHVTETEAFVALSKLIKTHLDKAEHERGFIYRQSVPDVMPELVPAKAIVQAEVYQPPVVHEMWGKADFDQTAIPRRGKDAGADLASSDDTKVKMGPNHAAKASGDPICSIQ